ncbi:hypothetical protein [Kutzneria sp. CA-103260]|uniref:hypothetical protein n=1 Tax=Kutzneria sp. CA-103260 TaxID=2802641 RepID=UPI001BEF4D22|nr:hypothetical protein [Kutzneria sp. CA-103260]QUQ71711.1 hypothetical protein JJ691_94980 [Kutzneria sp. CA-103260]
MSSNNAASSSGPGRSSGLLYVVLLCVLGAFALLVVALVSTQTYWAWGSVALSVVGAVVLLLDWQRRRRAQARPAAGGTAAAAEPIVDGGDDESDADPQEDEGGPGESQATGDLDSPATGGVRIGTNRDDQQEPAEEDTDAADALVVSELTDEVLVLDERPRYHLAACGWLGERPVIPLPVNEARQLGFTPCAVCTPDATLAAATRSATD